MHREVKGYLRRDGRVGIRNVTLVAYLVECAHHVAREIAHPYRDRGVHLIGFPGCYPNDYAARMMRSLCTHPNVGAVLLVSLGCESFDRATLEADVIASGRPVSTLVIQRRGGTRQSIETGWRWIEQTLLAMNTVPRSQIGPEHLVVGTICGGSDATSGIAA
ncbi:MAG: UxaA family hydrolase, partial [Verrucomicrobiia bacterium]